MKKLTINQLKETLTSLEVNFMTLDNYMSENGYYSVYDDGSINEIKDDKNVIYTGIDTDECEIIINFDIIPSNSDDEDEHNFTIKIFSVEEF